MAAFCGFCWQHSCVEKADLQTLPTTPPGPADGIAHAAKALILYGLLAHARNERCFSSKTRSCPQGLTQGWTFDGACQASLRPARRGEHSRRGGTSASRMRRKAFAMAASMPTMSNSRVSSSSRITSTRNACESRAPWVRAAAVPTPHTHRPPAAGAAHSPPRSAAGPRRPRSRGSSRGSRWCGPARRGHRPGREGLQPPAAPRPAPPGSLTLRTPNSPSTTRSRISSVLRRAAMGAMGGAPGRRSGRRHIRHRPSGPARRGRDGHHGRAGGGGRRQERRPRR